MHIHHQRAAGEIILTLGQGGQPDRLREAGSAKLRFAEYPGEGVLINTSGGLAGGDRLDIDVIAAAATRFTLTTQAAERVYRALPDDRPAEVTVTFRIDTGASLHWLPQETILFDGARLNRHITADLAADSEFLVCEAVMLGRAAMGEQVREANFVDQWRISRNGKLIHAEATRWSGAPPKTSATIGSGAAFCTLLLVSPRAEGLIEHVQPLLDPSAAASAWDGKLVARFRAQDSHELRQRVIPVLRRLIEPKALPKIWAQ